MVYANVIIPLEIDKRARNINGKSNWVTKI